MTTLNVRDFGALGNGTGDDTPAIQAALEQAYALADLAQTEVLVPPGDYRLMSGLQIGSYTRLTMYDARLFWGQTVVASMLRCRGMGPYYGYLGMHHITIKGGTFDGMRASVTDGTNLISIFHAHDIVIEGVRCTQIKDDHGIEINSSQHVVVRDCVIDNSSSKTEALQIDLATTAGLKVGAYDKTCCDDVLIERCRFGPGLVGRAVGSHNYSSGKYHTGIRIVDCEWLSTTAYAAVWALNWGVGCEVDLRGTQDKWLVWENGSTPSTTGRLRAAFEPLP
jgi:hypothetical protein